MGSELLPIWSLVGGRVSPARDRAYLPGHGGCWVILFALHGDALIRNVVYSG